MGNLRFVAILLTQDALTLLGLALVLRSQWGRALFGNSPFSPSQILLVLAILFLASDITETLLFNGKLSVGQYPTFGLLTDSAAALIALAVLGFWR